MAFRIVKFQEIWYKKNIFDSQKKKILYVNDQWYKTLTQYTYNQVYIRGYIAILNFFFAIFFIIYKALKMLKLKISILAHIFYIIKYCNKIEKIKYIA